MYSGSNPDRKAQLSDIYIDRTVKSTWLKPLHGQISVYAPPPWFDVSELPNIFSLKRCKHRTAG